MIVRNFISFYLLPSKNLYYRVPTYKMRRRLYMVPDIKRWNIPL